MHSRGFAKLSSQLVDRGRRVGKGERVVVITGATGRQGGAVIRHMQPRGWRLRALTRNPRGTAALDLAGRGVEVVAGDLDDLDSLEAALTGAYGVYSVQDFWTVGARREVAQGKSLAVAAKKARIAHFVYSSVGGAERNSGIDHWETKWQIEQYIRALELPATIIRPAAFMENYYIDQVEIGILKGRLVDPIRADKLYQTIAADDIGAFVALAFDRPAEFLGQAIEIAGSELTNRQAAEVFSRVLGKPVAFRRLPLPIVRLVLGREFYQMFRWFNRAGFAADIDGLRRRYPEIHLRSLEAWLREEGWHKRARRVRPPKG
jgi:uncharacterized protein YbjT (DUF2867 family)